MIEEKLWPTSLYFFETTHRNNNYLKDKILHFKDNNSSRKVSNVRGWQSEVDLIFMEEFEGLRSIINLCFGTLCSSLYKEKTYEADMLNGWANVNQKGAFNKEHTHGDSDWSCVYFVTDIKDPIFFTDPRPAKTNLFARDNFKTLEMSKNDAEFVAYNPKKGTLIFFPGWLKHGVYPTSTDEPRISIACNFKINAVSS